MQVSKTHKPLYTHNHNYIYMYLPEEAGGIGGCQEAGETLIEAINILKSIHHWSQSVQDGLTLFWLEVALGKVSFGTLQERRGSLFLDSLWKTNQGIYQSDNEGLKVREHAGVLAECAMNPNDS